MRRRLPLLITALLAVVIGVFSALAYRHIARALTLAAGERMSNVTSRLGEALAESETRVRTDRRRPGADSSFVAYLAAGDAASEQRARAALERYRASNDHIIAVELWSLHGERLLASTRTNFVASRFDAPVTQLFASHDLVGPMLARGDSVFIEVRMPVTTARGDTTAIVRQLQRVDDARSAALVRHLIGSDVQFLVGNSTGDIWSDLARRRAAPPGAPVVGRALEATSAEGERWLGATAAVPRTPWIVWVGLPRQVVLAPAHALLRSIGVLALIVLAGGAFVAWLIGRHLTRPLSEVISAVGDITSGDYSRRVAVRGRDELAQLAAAFNTMTAQVEASTEELRTTVALSNLMQEQLASERKFLRQVIDINPNFLFAKDRDGRFTLVNKACADAYGTTIDALIGKSDADFNPNAEEVEAFRRADMEVIESGVAKDVEEPITDSTGKVRWLHTMKRPIHGDDGRIDQLLGVSADITARKQLEEQLLQSQKMEAVGQLAGGVAHDFNNVLTAIKGFGELAMLQLEDGHPVRGDLAEICSSADRAAALTQQLLAFSRRQLLMPVLLSPNAVIEGISKLLARLIGAEVQCETRLAPDVGLVRADPGQLEQVLVNLAVNARDAMPNGGTLTIETANVVLDAEAAAHLSFVEVINPGRYAMLSVGDTGIGMSRATLSSIFQPFFTTKEPGKGTGLGLSTVYGIVHQSGGYLHVYSELGHGTNFKLFFPCAEGELADAVVAPAAAPEREVVETVLVVDDDDGVRNTTARILTRAGYSVLSAASPAAAEELWTTHDGPIHLLLTDVMMPAMDGGELSRRLLATRPSARVLYTSGYTNESVVGRGLITGDTAFLPKPFTIDAVLRKTREALAGRSVEVA
jgi:PAS domain S-box-containing protein